MKRLLIIGLLCCWVATLWAGTEIDSLKLSLQKATGGERIDILNQLSSLNHDADTRDALFYAREAMKYASSSGDKKRLSIAYINAGIVLRNTGQSDKALDYFFNAVNLTEQLGLPHIKADALHKISVAYLLVRDFDNALKYGKEEVVMWKELNDLQGLSKAQNSMGLIYINLGRFDEAEVVLKESLRIAEETNDLNLIFKPLLNIGDLYMTQDQPNKAVEYMERSKSISLELNNAFGITASYIKLGEAYFKTKDYGKAIEMLKLGKEKAQELQSLSLLRNAYKTLGDIYEEAGKYKDALEYNRLYISTEDSMIGEITKRKIAQAEARFDIAEMEREIERMTKESSFNTFRVIFIVALFALGGGLTFVLINRQKIKKESSTVLSDRDERLQEKTLLIAEQKRMIEDKEEQILRVSNYAERVQQAIIYNTPSFLNIFPDSFIHSAPKEVASGDFCWFAHKNDSIVIAIGDCTGHGMEGAFNTVVTHSLLTQIVNESQYRTPADILRELDKKLSKLIQAQKGQSKPDRIKIAVCTININTKRLIYAGAQIPLYIITNGQLKIIPADQQAIEGKVSKQIDVFNNQIVGMKKGDKIMLLTNGYQKQIGGERREALTEHKLVEVLAQNSAVGLPQIKENLLNYFEDWKGTVEQTDDAFIFGLVV